MTPDPLLLLIIYNQTSLIFYVSGLVTGLFDPIVLYLTIRWTPKNSSDKA